MYLIIGMELQKFVEEKLNNGPDVIFDIDWQGAQKLSDFSKMMSYLFLFSQVIKFFLKD